MNVILSIDIGTSSVKALAVDVNGIEVYKAQQSYSTYYPKPDFAEQNPDEILEAVKKLIRECPKHSKVKLAAISFSSAMHSIMAVDGAGKPLTPLIIWSDLRSKIEHQTLYERGQGLDLSINTGTPVHPMSPVCKVIWLKNNLPEIFDRTTKFIGVKEYIWFQFFGCYEIDQGIASATGMLQTGSLDWYPAALEAMGIDSSKLSKPVSVYHKRELLKTNLLADLGFSKSVVCVIGSSDGCLANLGSFIMDDKTLSLTVGTSGALRRTVKVSNPDSKGKVFRYHLDEQTWVEGGATNNGAILLEWYSRIFSVEKENLETIIKEATQLPKKPDDLIFVPYVFGERAPIYDPDASGSFYGIKKHHTNVHFLKAILEGVGFALFSISKLLELKGGSFEKLVASGGFTKSEGWVQIITDIFGKPMSLYEHENASALGAAIMGFHAIDLPYNFSQQPMNTFHPNDVAHRHYALMFERFNKLSK